MQAKSIGKSTFRAVVRHPDGTIKRDYGIVARTHPNPVVSWTYKQFYKVKRMVLDLHYDITHSA